MEQSIQERAALLLILLKLWRWCGWLLPFGLGIGGRKLLVSSKAMDEAVGAIMSSAAWGVITIAAGIFLLWVFFIVWNMTPKQRLCAKAELFESAMRELGADNVVGGEIRLKTKTLLHQTMHVLDKLKTPHPPFDFDVKRWLIFLSRLLAASRVGDLKWAKAIWPEMEAERQEMEKRARNT